MELSIPWLIESALAPVCTQLSAVGNMADKLETFGSLNVPGERLHSVPSVFDFRVPTSSLSESLLRKGKERYACR